MLEHRSGAKTHRVMTDGRVAAQVKIDTPTDLVLLVLRASGAHVAGITRLQKLVFLVTQDPEYAQLVRRNEAPDVRFSPYKMGPFNADLYEAVETLQSFRPSLLSAAEASSGIDEVETSRFIEDNDLDRSEPAYGQPMPTIFRLTPQGKTLAGKLWEIASPDLQRAIERVVRQYGNLPLRELLRRVYTQYPQWTSRSEIRDQLGLE